MKTTLLITVDHNDGQDPAAILSDLGQAVAVQTTAQVLTVTHKYGQDVWVRSSVERAKDDLLAYVSQWWENEMDGEPMPSDRDVAITAYFEAVEDWESYSIEEADLG